MGDFSKGSRLERNIVETKSVIGNAAHKGQAEEKVSKMSVPFYRLFCFADSTDIVLMTLGIIGAIANGLSRPLMAVLLGEFIDDFRGMETTKTSLYEVPLKFIYLAFGCGVGAVLQVTCWMSTGERQAARVRNLYLKAILRQEIAYFEEQVSTGELIGRTNGDTVLLQDAIGEKVGKFVQVIASFAGGFVIAFIKGWLLAFVMLSSYPIPFILGKIMHFLRKNIVFQDRTAHANAASLVQQTVGSIRTVASLTGEKQAVANYKKFLTTLYKLDTRVASSIGIEIGLYNFLSLCSIGLGIWFGARMILQKGYTAGEVFTVILAIILGSGYTSIRAAYPCIAAFTAGQVVAFKMFEVINREPTIDAYDVKGKLLNDINGDIELQNVFFSYRSRPEELVLNGISLLIPNGTTTALVGPSGSGKSTVLSMIERLYDPQSGKVLIDEIDLREFQLKWIRSKIGLVSQEPVLFTTSIRDNIAYGKDGATLEEILAAATLANADDFIKKLPEGLDTRVGEHGIQLSGGQKQRVAIARAILKDPRVLLLDEATSALDTRSESIVQEALEKIMKNRTTIVVAHRLSTIRSANMIAVLQQGKIVEKGAHFELLKNPTGIYSTLVSSQEIIEVGEQRSECYLDNAIKPGGRSDQRISTMRSLSFASYETSSITSCSESMSTTTSATSDDKVKPVETTKDIQRVSMFRLACLNKPELPLLMVATIFSIIGGALPPTYAFLISNAIKTFYEKPHELKKGSEFWALMFVILGMVSCISHPLKIHLFGVVGNKLIQRIRLQCFTKVINMEIGWFDDPQNSSAVIGARLSNDAAKVRVLVGDALGDLVQVTASIVVGLMVSFEASWQLSLIVLAMLPMIGFNIYIQMKTMKGFSNDAKMKYEEANQVASDAIANIRTIASFCAQDIAVEIHKKKCQAPVVTEIKHGLISGIGFGISVCFLYLVYAVIFFAGVKSVRDGKVIASDVFRVYYALAMVSHVIYSSSTLAVDSNKAKGAIASIFAILDRESKIDPADESGMILEDIKGQIELLHVNFSYPVRSGVQVLRDLSLVIHSGKVVALVGESGSGKSTIISLLQRFYNPDSGHITIDGIEIHKFQLKWLRQQIGLVSQEPILFNDTIRANIASGKGGSATETEIIAAARLSNAHEFISSLQQGYDTIVGERGVQLSGGQKQRVALARAVIKNPKILMLDEATSALDVQSEKIVQVALEKVTQTKTKTTIMVAHRLSTVRGADIIAVMENGSIVEKGNHNTLMENKNGVYSSLVTLHKAVSE